MSAADDILDARSPRIAPPLLPGDPVPWFRARTDINPDYPFASLGGRRIVLTFLGSFSDARHRPAFEALCAAGRRFGGFTSAMMLVTADPADDGMTAGGHVVGLVFDDARRVAALFGVEPGAPPTTFLIDERLRVLAVVRTRDAADHAAQVLALFARIAPLDPPAPAPRQAPALIVPRVFEPELCGALIAGFEAHGGEESGFMVERDGRTVGVVDHRHKRRTDWNIEDRALISACHERIQRRLIPEIARAFQFTVTRIERSTVACYRAEDGGHFSRHRDNTTKGTAHRRFAVSINLNAGDYEGGDLAFPEYGRALFRPPTGGACVFSCSMLHEATPVTRGVRYVFVPFLYDEEAAALRRENVGFVDFSPAQTVS
jgi:predicted 2-oxoglutarate/Fe(II)-dependent dioxygenase YbiX